MIHIETLQKFKENLPNAEDFRGKVLRLNKRVREEDRPVNWEGDYREWDTTSNYRSPDFPKPTPIVFRADFVQNKWQWVYVGEVVI